MRAVVRRGKVVAVAAAGAMLAALLAPGASNADPGWVPGIAALSEAGVDVDEAFIAAAPDGSAVALWNTYVVGGVNEVHAATRAPNGVWESPVNLTPGSSARHNYLDVAIGHDGTIAASWTRDDGSAYAAQAAVRKPGQAWGVPVSIVALPNGTGGARIAVGPDGRVTAVTCPTGVMRNVNVAAHTATGGWVNVGTVAVDLEAPCGAEVAVGGDGSTTIVWYERKGATRAIKATHQPVGGSYGAPVTLSTTNDVTQHEVAAGRDGTVAVTWIEGGAPNDRMLASVRPSGGSWSPAADFLVPGVNAFEPRVGVGADGSTTVAWQAGSPHGVYAVSKPASGAWGPIVTLDGPLPADPWVDVAVGPDAVATVIWIQAGQLRSVSKAAGGSWGAVAQVSTEGVPTRRPAIAAGSGGDATALWKNVSGADHVVEVRQLDGSGPVIGSVNAPTSGVVGTSLAFTASASDKWSSPTTLKWDFGDGTTAAGASVTHTFGTEGRRTVTVTATDALGNTTTQTVGAVEVAAAPVPLRAPVISKFRLTRKKISISGKGKTARKTKAVLRVSTKARVTMTFKLRGAKGKRARVTTIRRQVRAKAGTTRVVVKARMGKKKRLRPGVYVVTVRAKNAAGRSTVKKAKLRVVR